MTFVFIYYNNPNMLIEQIKHWNSYSDLANPPKIILVDDSSRIHKAIDVLRGNSCSTLSKLFYVEQDIAWNFSGARNLGCLNAEEDRIYVSDSDTILPVKEASKLISSKLDDNTAYILAAKMHHNTTLVIPPIVNMVFTKEMYTRIGGYDEDFCGFYGLEHVDFYERMKKIVKVECIKGVTLEVVYKSEIPDAVTPGVKKFDRNLPLFKQKVKNGLPNPTNPLRFTWTQLI